MEHTLKDYMNADNAANIMLVVTAKDLKELLQDAMDFAINAIKEHKEPSYYTRQELADKLHISLVTLQRWRSDGLLPEPTVIDRHVLFNKAEVRDMLNANRRLSRKLASSGVLL